MSRLIDGDYLYDRLVANKCPYELVLQMIKEEPTVCDIEQIRDDIASHVPYIIDDATSDAYTQGLGTAISIIDKHMKGDSE